jgi:hypothetical protein
MFVKQKNNRCLITFPVFTSPFIQCAWNLLRLNLKNLEYEDV